MPESARLLLARTRTLRARSVKRSNIADSQDRANCVRSALRLAEASYEAEGGFATSAPKGKNPSPLGGRRMTGRAELPKLLTMDELAESLGVTRRHVRRLVAEKRLLYLKVGRFIRFDPAEIAAWLDSNPVAGSRRF